VIWHHFRVSVKVMNPVSRRFLLLLPLLLAACGGRSDPGAGAYLGGPVVLDCVPFARALSGVQLRGDAADWWDAAQGRYARARIPEAGAVLVFARSRRLAHGHAAVVSRVLSDREVLVTQANWEHGRVTADQPVLDTSPDNSWTRVRVWWPPGQRMGSTDYPTRGFIRPPKRTSAEEVAEATPRALRVATAQ